MNTTVANTEMTSVGRVFVSRPNTGEIIRFHLRAPCWLLAGVLNIKACEYCFVKPRRLVRARYLLIAHAFDS